MGSSSLRLAFHRELCCPLANSAMELRGVSGWCVRAIAGYKGALGCKDTGKKPSGRERHP